MLVGSGVGGEEKNGRRKGKEKMGRHYRVWELGEEKMEKKMENKKKWGSTCVGVRSEENIKVEKMGKGKK